MISGQGKTGWRQEEVAPSTLLLAGFFFFNTFLLPAGLLYTTLLTPLFFLLLLRRGNWKGLAVYAALSLPLWYYHIRVAEALPGVYLKSYLLFSSAVIFTIWAYHFLQVRLDRLAHYFRQITIYNTLFTGLAVLVLAIPRLNELFWYFVPIHPAIPAFPRLKMLVYEPSFYSLQLAPIFLYFFTAFLFGRQNRHLLEVLLLAVSLLLSLSFGVLGGLALAVLLIFLLHAWRLLRRRKVFFATFYLLLISGGVAFVMQEYFPFNPVADRIDKVLAGHDTSANGRTWEAFLLAWRILGETSYLMGAGLGQVKEVGQDIIVNYYNYEGEWAGLVRIPNTMAETLATFGLLGAVGRILAQVVLFVATGVYRNYYRLMLFAFLFIYQFTGSYLTNIYEYLAWVIVFLPAFPRFDKERAH